MYVQLKNILSAGSKPCPGFVVDNGIITVIAGICDNRTQMDRVSLSLLA